MRIRTVKPEFFLHEVLFDLEKSTKLPVRIAFLGLICAADREGRFKWNPRRLKAQIMPYDNADFEKIMNCLDKVGMIVKYCQYGMIPNFLKHQHINVREAQSTILAPEETCNARECTCTHVHARGEGKGREGKGRERKENPPTPLKGGCGGGDAFPDATEPNSDSGDMDETPQTENPPVTRGITQGITSTEVNEFFDLWNLYAEANGWTPVKARSDLRKKKVKTRLSNKQFAENITKVLDMMTKDDFYAGGNDRRWTADIEYILRPSSFDKLIDKLAKTYAPLKKPPEPEGWREMLHEILNGHLAPMLSDFVGIQHIQEFERLPTFAQDFIEEQINEKKRNAK